MGSSGFLRILFTSFILLTASAKAEPFTGLSSFAAAHPRFPCSTYLATIKKTRRPIVTVLYGTFGHNYRCLRRIGQVFRNKEWALEWHLSNEARRRTGQLYQGELFRRVGVRRFNLLLQRRSALARARIQARTRRILAITHRLNPTVAILSVGLEDNYTSSGARIVGEWVREIWPFYVARNPLHRHSNNGFDFMEQHGLFPNCNRGTIANSDGIEVPGPDEFRHRTRNCYGRVLWTAGLQGIGQRYIRPRDRTFRLTNSDILKYRIFAR